MEEGKYCTALFLDVEKAFDKGMKGLVKIITNNFTEQILLYILNRYFYVKIGNVTFTLKEIHAGVSQGSDLGPVLYPLFTVGMPIIPETGTYSFADNTSHA